MLTPSTFFNLDQFKHKALFEEITYVYEALNILSSYLAQQELRNIQTEIPQGAILANEETISIGEGTKVEPGAFIQGPCIIGKNCQVRHGAYIRGNLIAGDHVVIGHATEVKNSIMLNHAHAAHFAYVGDSILGGYVNLGAGVKCANLRFDKKSIRIRIDGEILDTKRRKFGAIIGDRGSIGCNAVLNPGTILYPDVIALPNQTLSGIQQKQ